jgi:hypothetical protein
VPSTVRTPVDLGPAADGQVGATANVLGQVGDPGALADAGGDGERDSRYPAALIRVRIVDVTVALLFRCVDEGLHGRGELVVAPLVDRERPGAAVESVFAALGVLQNPVGRQYLVP